MPIPKPANRTTRQIREKNRKEANESNISKIVLEESVRYRPMRLTEKPNTDNEKQEINISCLSSGSYILSIESDGLNIQNKKVMITK